MRRNPILLDTHIILWMFEGNEKLSQKARTIISDNIDSIYYSVASMWEVQIKYGIKKMPISGREFMHYCEQSGYHKLPVDDMHIIELANLQREEGAVAHNDPFDRILLSQAKAEGFSFVTHDPLFRAYNENCVVEV
ncbi:MAG: type II toxin-antitoxin system VapC family toxin [Treponema sp.]|nr:type II toxin-antitoxin system VapC family toxin [Treponema sp.]